jgi:hypothetical protein
VTVAAFPRRHPLAAAIAVGADTLVTYDSRLAAAATELGLPVTAPT